MYWLRMSRAICVQSLQRRWGCRGKSQPASGSSELGQGVRAHAAAILLKVIVNIPIA
jgi:hypothetical protein